MVKNTREHVIGEFPDFPPIFPCSRTQTTVAEVAYNKLYAGTGEGSEMRGWMNWPKEYFVSGEYKKLKETAKNIRENNDSVIVIGIGGSYLTPQMVIHSEYGPYYNEIAQSKGLPKIYFAGCDLSPDNLNQIIEMVSDGDWSIIYISKSGGTMEPALAFRILWKSLQEKYGDEADKRVYAVTDAEKGILKSMANEHEWESFVIPDNIGGRYSGFTACGLLPIAVAGIDTDKLLEGAIDAVNDCEGNPDCFAAKYAEWRYYNYSQCRLVETFAMNSPYLSYLGEWLKQLFGESEGKNDKGLFPTSVVFPTDLHSLGQYLQEGVRDLIFETFIERDFKDDITIPESGLNDNLDTRAGKKFSQAAAAAMDGAYKAHTEGGNPCSIIRVGNTLEDMGYVMQSMFIACAISSYMLEVNPFNQPGVEAHKMAMKTSPKWDE